MIERPITYEDLDGKEFTEVFSFHISKLELIDLEVENKQGFKAMIEEVIASDDRKALVDQFKKFILMSYGVRSEDRKRFIKTDELRDEFAQTQAYEALFMELVTVDGAAVDFLTGILPRDLRDDVAKLVAETHHPDGTPKSPVAPVPPVPPKSTPSGV